MTMYNAIFEASTQLNVSKGQLIEIVKDYRVHGDLKTPKQYRRKKDFFEKLRPDQLQLFRMIIHDMFKKINEKKKDKTAAGLESVPTVRSILKIINDQYSEHFPHFTERKVWVTMQRLGFRYKKHPETKNVLLIGMYNCSQFSSLIALLIDFLFHPSALFALLFSFQYLSLHSCYYFSTNIHFSKCCQLWLEKHKVVISDGW